MKPKITFIILLILIIPTFVLSQTPQNWENIGPYGMNINSIFANKLGHLFINVGSSLLSHISKDDGNTWIEFSSQQEYTSPFKVLFEDNNGIYYGKLQIGSNKIFKSSDNCKTWTTEMKSFNHIVNSMAITKKGHVFVGVQGTGVYMSKDNWNSFSIILPSIDKFAQYNNIHVVNDQYSVKF